jgi:putative membrane protein
MRFVDSDNDIVYWYHGIQIEGDYEKKLFTSEFDDDYDAVPMYEQIYALAGRIGQFDPIVLEPNLAALNNWTGGVERIKSTPIPRQYSFFSRAFIATLTTLLPFSLVGLLDGALLWWLVPLSVVGAGLFILLERTSEVNDEPFSNSVTDIPMTAICQQLERDLRELLGDTTLPDRPLAVNGYLW